MNSVYLLTNGGTGEDGDEWLLDGIYRTRLAAEQARHDFFQTVEEWPLLPCVHIWEYRGTNPTVSVCAKCEKIRNHLT